MISKLSSSLIVLLIICCNQTSLANNYIVTRNSKRNKDFSSIKEAIRNAKSGDTIFIEPGVYTESNIHIDKDIIIVGHNRNTTFLQASHISDSFAGRIITIEEGAEVEISGITLSNGTSQHFGGGILTNGNLRLINTTIRNCFSEAPGGGIAIIGGYCEMINTQIVNNTSESEGGGIYLNKGNLNIKRSEISSNTAKFWGGGLKADDAALNMNNTMILENEAKNGAGVYVHLTPASFSRVSFKENITADHQENSLYVFTMDQDLSVFLDRCYFDKTQHKRNIIQEAYNSKNYLFVDNNAYNSDIYHKENDNGNCKIIYNGPSKSRISLN